MNEYNWAAQFRHNQSHMCSFMLVLWINCNYRLLFNDDDDNEDDVFSSQHPKLATFKSLKVNVVVGFWDTTTILFMTNAKDSFGLGAWETETDFLTKAAATPPVLASTVSTNVHCCWWMMRAYVNMSIHVLRLSHWWYCEKYGMQYHVF